MPSSANIVLISHPAASNDAEREVSERILSCAVQFEEGIGRDFRENSLKWYRQYRGFRQFRDDWTKAGPNDRDGVVYDAQKHWGAHLHIPLSFRTIETMVPRAIAHAPSMQVLPRRPEWEANAQSMKMLLDAQQQNINIELPFQAVMRSGRIYGLGVGKSPWRKETSVRRRMKKMLLRSGYRPGRLETVVEFDDPTFEDVDIFDFMWDPYGSDIESSQWLIHRWWLSTQQVLDRIESGVWATETAKGLERSTVESFGDGQRYDEVWQQRMAVSGFGSFSNAARGEQPHEVLEWHDGTQVCTLLDRTFNVQAAESPCAGRKVFQVYRPTPLNKQMVGIGDLEPIEHLQRELDTLRSQRRDSATMALAGGYAYDQASVDAEDLRFGPNMAIPVRNSAPGDAIMPLQHRDVPGSGYQEEQVIRTDFDAVTGIQDGLDNSPGGSAGTATEATLVQAALGRRIELSSRRFEIEVVRNAARCWVRMNQRMISEQRDPIRMPEHGVSMEEAIETSRWKWFPVDPGALQGEFQLVMEGGSMAAKNVPQERQDGQMIMQNFFQNPFIDPRKPLLYALKKFGVEDGDAWLKKQEMPIPATVIESIKAAFPDQAPVIDFLVVQAQQQDPQLTPDGPGAQQQMDPATAQEATA